MAGSRYCGPGVIDWTALHYGEHRLACPACGRGGSDKTLGATVDEVGGVAHCFRCSFVETWRDASIKARPSELVEVKPAAHKRETLSEHGEQLWAECCGLRDTVAADYLAARCCPLPPENGHLRYHQSLEHPTGYVGPALVALVTDAITRVAMSLHWTWIRADGSKADVDPPRRLLGGHRKQGGVIRLWPDEDVSYGLGIAEGIETCLTLAKVLQPVWCVIDAGNMAAFPVLRGIEALTIAADNDPSGLKGAEKCATAWSAAGAEVRIVMPPQEGFDLNDFERASA